MQRLHAIVLAIFVLSAIAFIGCQRARQTRQTAGAVNAAAGPTHQAQNPATSGHLKVVAACGVAGPYGEIRKLFKQEHPNLKIDQEIGNIVTMATRLRDGKLNADLFMTVGSTSLQKLNEDGLLAEAPVTFAEDELVVLVPEGNPAEVTEFQHLASPQVETLAVAASKSTPGRFAEMAVRRAGLWEKVQDKIVRPDLPSMLKSFVADGRADAAVMLLTCATKEAKMGEQPAEGVPGTEIALKVPHEYYDPLQCQIGIMKNASNIRLARKFADFTRAQSSQQILSKWDFIPCEDAGA